MVLYGERIDNVRRTNITAAGAKTLDDGGTEANAGDKLLPYKQTYDPVSRFLGSGHPRTHHQHLFFQGKTSEFEASYAHVHVHGIFLLLSPGAIVLSRSEEWTR